MATELTTTMLNHESHLLLDQPLIRLPQELLRKNFKTAQKHITRESNEIPPLLKATANASFAGQPVSETVASLDTMINRMAGLKRKMESIRAEEKALHHASKNRLQHLQDLYDIPSLADVKYDEWSRIRLDRLLVEYLVRQGYTESARALARDRNVEDLVDLEVFDRCARVVRSLRGRGLEDALAWCSEHKVVMRKGDNRLEFELRLQQYIELCRNGRPVDARIHAKKYFPAHMETQSKKIYQAACLLAFPPTAHSQQYLPWYSQSRWDELAALFTETHHQLYSLPSQPLLLIALSAGLSSLKTPSCHSEFASSTANASSSTTTVCPICSTELNELARRLPYAHHTKSHVENDPVVLPNGRVYGRERLFEMSKKVGLEEGWVKDPTEGDEYKVGELRRVYIS